MLLICSVLAFIGGTLLTLWQAREAKRLERLLGHDVGWVRASGALKLRRLQHDRASYPHEWHRGSRRVATANVLQVLAFVTAFLLAAAGLS